MIVTDVVDPGTRISPGTGVKSGYGVCPFTCVRSSIIVNSGYVVCPFIDVVGNAHVNGGGGIFRTTIVTTLPRSFGFANRRDRMIVNSGGAVHRGIIVGHNARGNNGAILNGGGFLVRNTRVSRSAMVNGNYMFNCNAGVTNSYIVNGNIVCSASMMRGTGAEMNSLTVVRTNAAFSGSVPPCVVTNKGPIGCTNPGAVVVRTTRIARGIHGRVTGTCQLMFRNRASLFSTVGRVGSRIPSNPRVRGVVRFLRDSRGNIVAGV